MSPYEMLLGGAALLFLLGWFFQFLVFLWTDDRLSEYRRLYQQTYEDAGYVSGELRSLIAMSPPEARN